MNDINREDIENWRNETCDRSTATIVIETALFVVIELLALIGNIMVVMAVYRNKTLRSITHQYIVTLAIADFLAALIILPLSIVSSGTGNWPYGPKVCYFQGTSILIWGTFSMSVVSITAINRFFCVVKPNMYRTIFTTRNTLIVIAVTLAGCVLFVVGISVGFSATFMFGPHLFCIPTFPTKKLQMSVMLTAFFFFIFIPMVTMVVCYFKVYRRVKQHAHRVAPMLCRKPLEQTRNRCDNTNFGRIEVRSLQNGVDELNVQTKFVRKKVRNLRQGVEEARITKVVLVVLVLFFLFWIPICIIGTLFIIGVTVIPRRVHLLYDYFLVANAASNPIVYGLFNKGFRTEYVKMLGLRAILAKRITFSVEEFTGSIINNDKNAMNENENTKL